MIPSIFLYFLFLLSFLFLLKKIIKSYRCVEKEELQIVSEGLEHPLTREAATKKLKQRLDEDYSELLHNISGCHLPAEDNRLNPQHSHATHKTGKNTNK